MKKEHYRGILVAVCDGVYRPAEDSFLLVDGVLDFLPEGNGKTFLEMGVGAGMASVAAFLKGYEVFISDVNPNAVKCALENIKRAGGDANIILPEEFFNSSGATFDVIAFNPPYLPGNEEIPIFEKLAVEGGGNDGTGVIRLFLSSLPYHMKDDSVVLIVISSMNRPERLMEAYPNLSFHLLKSTDMGWERLYLYLVKPLGEGV
ncbi:MAG: methyltransferase [Thermoplasmata archaeon]|nr:methyltransferase [Thermoplasmata archaeon]